MCMSDLYLSTKLRSSNIGNDTDARHFPFVIPHEFKIHVQSGRRNSGRGADDTSGQEIYSCDTTVHELWGAFQL